MEPPRRNALMLQLATGKPRLGLWCDTCLLPSGVEVDVHTMCTEHGSHLVGTYTECLSCGQSSTRVTRG